jgi:phosphomannomutase
MERSIAIVVVLSLAAAAGLFFVSVYLSLIALVVAAVVAATIAIGRDTYDLPDIQAALADDARAVLVRNSGNAPALQVHVSVVPLGLDFDIPSLAVEEVHEEPLPGQAAEVKVVVTFKNGAGHPFRRTALLSALRPDADPLRPPFAIFGWK